MSKDVKFTIKLKIDGKDHVVEASTNVKKFAREFENARTSANKFRDKLVELNQTVQSLQNIASGFQQIGSTLQKYTAAYAVQQEAETKLATAMRNTMGARDEDIQSIKDLCAAQQELGVIGDEVQLSGAQELATYLEKKSSLERLIPVMNDMVAQQYGLNATSEAAASIATMLGKVMQGQTSALSRYGYSFTEAQEEILKFGTESARAAVLAEVVGEAVGGMNAELAKTDAGKAKQVANAFGDLQEKMGAFASDITTKLGPIVSIIADIGIASSSLVTVAKGLQAVTIAAANSRKSMGFLGMIVSATNLKFKQSAAISRIFGAALQGSAYKAVALKLALRGLLITTGVGAVIAAVTFLIEKLVNAFDDAADAADNFAEKVDDLKDAAEEYEKTTADVQSQLQIEAARLAKLKDGTAAARDKVAELNRTYGDAFGRYKTAAEWYDVLTQKSRAYAQQLGYEAQAKVLAARKAEKEMQMEANAAEAQRLVHSGKDAHSSEVRALYDANRKLMAEVNGLQKAFDECIDKGAAAAAELAGGVERTTPAVTAEPAEPRYDGKTLIHGAQTYKELGNNIAYYQHALEGLAPTEVEQIKRIAGEIRILEAKRAAIDAIRAAASAPAELRTLGDIDEAISRQQALRRTASAEAVAGIDDEIARLERERRAMEFAAAQQSAVAKLRHDEITTREQLNAKTAYYNTLMEQGTEADRRRARQGLDALERIGERWDAMAAKSQFRLDATGEVDATSLRSLRDVDAAISLYTEQQQREDASRAQQTQAIIDRLTKRREALRLGIELPSMQREVDELEALSGREYRIKVKGIGLEGLTDKVRELDRLLANPDLGEAQRRQLERLRASYQNMRHDAAATFDTFRSGYASVRGIGDSVQGLTQALEGNGNAWQTTTAVVDAFLGIYEGIASIVGIVQMLAAASEAHATAETTRAAAVGATAVAEGVETGVAEGSLPAVAAVIAANKAATASYMELAASEYMAAHAAIPFAGFAIGAGFSASAVALVQGIGLTPFAEGGVVSGPTMALIGEYAGATNNPEVVAPLDRLRDLIQPTEAAGGKVEFRIEGRDLVGVLRREKKILERS